MEIKEEGGNIMSDYVRQSVGGRIRERRKALKISVDDLAEYCDVSPEHIRKIEGGYRAPGIDVLVDICNMLRTSSNYFFQDLVTEAEEEKKTFGWEMAGLSEEQRKIMETLYRTGIELIKSK